ncbi:hypothetical protein [Alcaligenes faecalis]|uniref:hypothetical protein n=1 Tax=Alcaligenes faecalis TaxID=511 RepID=UPI00129392C9|nr:hypothetical protein [Alcaligenes faecalis]
MSISKKSDLLPKDPKLRKLRVRLEHSTSMRATVNDNGGVEATVKAGEVLGDESIKYEIKISEVEIRSLIRDLSAIADRAELQSALKDVARELSRLSAAACGIAVKSDR